MAGERDDARRDVVAPPDYEIQPPELRFILARCLAPSPVDRFQSAHELYDALAAVYDPTAWRSEDADEFWRNVERRRFGSPSGRVREPAATDA